MKKMNTQASKKKNRQNLIGQKHSKPVQGFLPQSYQHRKPSMSGFSMSSFFSPKEKNETDVRVVTESISPTSRKNSEASRQNFEVALSTQDQDIVHEQIQERMEPENEKNIL